MRVHRRRIIAQLTGVHMIHMNTVKVILHRSLYRRARYFVPHKRTLKCDSLMRRKLDFTGPMW